MLRSVATFPSRSGITRARTSNLHPTLFKISKVAKRENLARQIHYASPKNSSTTSIDQGTLPLSSPASTSPLASWAAPFRNIQANESDMAFSFCPLGPLLRNRVTHVHQRQRFRQSLAVTDDMDTQKRKCAISGSGVVKSASGVDVVRVQEPLTGCVGVIVNQELRRRGAIGVLPTRRAGACAVSAATQDDHDGRAIQLQETKQTRPDPLLG